LASFVFLAFRRDRFQLERHALRGLHRDGLSNNHLWNASACGMRITPGFAGSTTIFSTMTSLLARRTPRRFLGFLLRCEQEQEDRKT